MGTSRAELSPIQPSDAPAIALFLHTNLNSEVSASAWAGLLDPPWSSTVENRGFQLTADGEIVGAYAAVYSERNGRSTCNLAAFCVLEGYRAQGMLLVRALLRQKNVVFTDLSPSGNVVAMNERLGFRRLDSATRIVVNAPRPPSRKHRVTGDPRVIESTLQGPDVNVHRDHRRASAAQHVIVTSGGRYAYLVFRADRRKGLRLFATPLYVGGDRALLEQAWGAVRAHILWKHRLPFFLAERRILGFATGLGVEQKNPRPKMYRGDVDPDSIDYLYSELALVSW